MFLEYGSFKFKVWFIVFAKAVPLAFQLCFAFINREAVLRYHLCVIPRFTYLILIFIVTALGQKDSQNSYHSYKTRNSIQILLAADFSLSVVPAHRLRFLFLLEDSSLSKCENTKKTLLLEKKCLLLHEF